MVSHSECHIVSHSDTDDSLCNNSDSIAACSETELLHPLLAMTHTSWPPPRPKFPNSLFPSWDSCLLSHKFSHQPRRLWTTTRTSATTLGTGTRASRTARTSTSWGAQVMWKWSISGVPILSTKICRLLQSILVRYGIVDSMVSLSSAWATEQFQSVTGKVIQDNLS